MTRHRKAKEISKDLRARRFHKENGKAGKISSTSIRWGDCEENIHIPVATTPGALQPER